MPAVVRVKRRIDEEPLEAFVLNGKKRRIDESEASVPNCNSKDILDANKNEISTILKFAGTVQSQDERVATQIARLTKGQAIELAKKHREPTISATERGRQEMRAQSQQNRFKVVNCFRTIDTDAADDAAPKEITIVDIEKQSVPSTSTDAADPSNIATTSSNGQTVTSNTVENFTPTDDDGYVYDLYLPENEQQADDVDYTDNYLSIRVYDELIFEDSYNDEAEESEDSNDENYFKNDYPDEEGDEDDSLDGDMRRAMNGLNIDGSDEEYLSSDEEYLQPRNGFVCSIDATDEGFENDVDYYVADRYGLAYERYRKRILREMKGEYSDDEDSNDDDDSFRRNDSE